MILTLILLRFQVGYLHRSDALSLGKETCWGQMVLEVVVEVTSKGILA